jgi:uncharacterized membrane protein
MALLIGLPGCGTKDAERGDALSLDALENAEYLSEWVDEDRVRLEDGAYEDPELRLRIVLATHAAGDLDGDELNDAAVVLVIDPGGSGTFYDLAAVVNVGGAPKNIASHPLGDRVQLDSMAIEAGKVILKMVTHGPDDPMCCPTLAIEATYALQGNSLVELSRKALTGGLPEGSDLEVAAEFKALGNEPYWNVEISAGGIVFERLGEGVLNFPYSAPTMSNGRPTYSSRTSDHSIEIVLEQAACVDNMSGARFDYTARVELDGNGYSGCAKAGPSP